jgi:glutathione S-transferase
VLRDAPELGDEPQLGKLLLQGHSDVLARFKIHQPDEGALELAWICAPVEIRLGFDQDVDQVRHCAPPLFRGDNARPPQRFRLVGHFLGDSSFLLADRPTSADTAVFGLLAPTIYWSLETPVAMYARSRPKLKAHIVTACANAASPVSERQPQRSGGANRKPVLAPDVGTSSNSAAFFRLQMR